MEQAVRIYLLDIAHAYAEAKGLALPTVSRRFHGADTFLSDFSKGKCSLTLRKLDEMIEQFREQWPTTKRMPTFKFHQAKKISDKLRSRQTH